MKKKFIFIISLFFHGILLPSCSMEDELYEDSVARDNDWINPLYEKGHFPVSEYTNFINMCKEWQGHNGAVIDTFIPKMIRDSFGKVRPPLKP